MFSLFLSFILFKQTASAASTSLFLFSSVADKKTAEFAEQQLRAVFVENVSSQRRATEVVLMPSSVAVNRQTHMCFH